MGSLGVRPRRGAWEEGSRRARAVAAACLAALAVAWAAPATAEAYPCGDGGPAAAQSRQLLGVASDQCRVPEKLRRTHAPERKRKTGSVSGLTAFVLAIAGALLIPIGRKGLSAGGDPFGHDPSHDSPL